MMVAAKMGLMVGGIMGDLPIYQEKRGAGQAYRVKGYDNCGKEFNFAG